MIRFHAFLIAMVPAITRPCGSPRRLARELSKATGVHVKDRGERLVDCEWLYTSVDRWECFFWRQHWWFYFAGVVGRRLAYL